MKILVTGGAGFIGFHTVEKLLEQEVEVVVVDHLDHGEKTFTNPPARLYAMDIESEELTGVFAEERPDAVIHLAAQVSVQRSLENPDLDARSNILGTVNLLKRCVEYGVSKFVFASSAAVYGSAVRLPIREDHPTLPMSFYGASKRTAEEYIQLFSELYGLNYTILRYANVYGIGQNATGESGVVSQFIGKLLAGEQPVVYGNGWQTRDFVYVKDVAAANIAALSQGSRTVLNIGSGRQTSINGLIRFLGEVAGRELIPEYRPGRDGDIQDSLLDSRQAAKALGWEAVYSMIDGLKETVEYESGRLGVLAP